MGVIVHIFTGIALYAFLAVHPFYVSVCEIQVVEQKKSIQVMQRIFADDFEEALNKKYDLQLDILAMDDLTSLNEIFENYYQEYFFVELDGKRLPFTYVGSEREEDVVWCYLEATYADDFSEIRVHNSLLMDEFEGQSNLVHVTKTGTIKSLKLSKSKQEGLLQF